MPQLPAQAAGGDWIIDMLATSPLMLILGSLSHFLKAIVELRNSGQKIGFRQYWFQHKYQSLLSVVASLCMYVILWYMGELTPLTAYGAGYMGDHAADLIGKRTGGKL